MVNCWWSAVTFYWQHTITRPSWEHKRHKIQFFMMVILWQLILQKWAIMVMIGRSDNAFWIRCIKAASPIMKLDSIQQIESAPPNSTAEDRTQNKVYWIKLRRLGQYLHLWTYSCLPRPWLLTTTKQLTLHVFQVSKDTVGTTNFPHGYININFL